MSLIASSTARPAAKRHSATAARRVARVKTGLLLGMASALALFQLFPILWMVLGAFKPGDEVTGARILPQHPTFDNITEVFTRIPFAKYLLNSFVTSIAVTILLVGFGSLAGYALARMRFRGREVVFGLYFSTLLVALPVIVVPLYIVVSELGLADTYAGLIIPVSFTAFPVFLMRQFYLQFPRDLEEAADLDGAGYLRRFVSIVLPLSKPMLAALGVLTFLATWNSFLWPLTVAKSDNLWVVQVGIATFQSQYGGEWNLIMAASMIAAIPTLVVFLLLQRQIIESIKATGLKG
jgi:multiple sugar transport system permease protein